MHSLLTELLKHKPLITVANHNNSLQIVLVTDPLPSNEDEFKKFFMISMNMYTTVKQQHIIIRCNILSKRTLCNIKFDSNKPQFMVWLTKEKIYIESNTLGVAKTTTIGYLTKVHPHLMNCNNLKQLLQVAFNNMTIDANLAIKLDNTLKDLQTMAMTNGVVFTPNTPPFELYKTKISHRHNKEKVTTEVIGIKCTLAQA